MKTNFLRNSFFLLFVSFVVLFIVNNYIITSDTLRYILLFIEFMAGLYLYHKFFFAIILIGLFGYWNITLFQNDKREREEAMFWKESNKTIVTIWRVYKENNYYHILLSNEYFMSDYRDIKRMLDKKEAKTRNDNIVK